MMTDEEALADLRRQATDAPGASMLIARASTLKALFDQLDRYQRTDHADG